MTANTSRRVLLAATLTGALLLAGCYVDEDGDGIDDNTGKPIPVYDQGADTAATTDPATWTGGAYDAARYVVAPHEGGHVVCAREKGWPVSARIWEEDGWVRGRTNIAWWVLRDPHDRLVCLLAGGAVATADDHQDERDVERLLGTHPDLDYDAALAEATRIVTERAAEVDQVAATLLKEGRL